MVDVPNTAIAIAAVSVGSTATALPTTALSNRRFLRVQNLGTANVYLGTSGVTTSTGIAMAPNGDTEFWIGAAVTLYGIVASGTCDVRVFEQS